MSRLLSVLDEGLGVMTLREAEQILGLETLIQELDILPEGEVEVISILPADMPVSLFDSSFLLRRGVELGPWI
ncbi:MAG: hypothetical protein Q8N81_07685 [bacterium]|nr:hypothetical protein [bacterium]